MNSHVDQKQPNTLLGHPTGLFTLFFAEMWERFSYYGMRSLLVFYMIKGFLGYGDNEAYGVYGAYTALVYATPFLGGMLADRLLGARRAVILGGLLMAAGHFTMTVENETVFFLALALLICGNGFFKPNISTIVGSLYPKGSVRKDAGFTIFYMGINLGAAMSPVICGYVGETFGWHYGFGLATVGMLAGVGVFVAPTRLTQAMILAGALGTAIGMPFLQDTPLQLAVRLFLSAALVLAGIIAFVALHRGGVPRDAGAPLSEERLASPAFPLLRQHAVTYYLAIIAGVFAAQQLTEPAPLEAWMLAGVAGAAMVLPWVTAKNAVYVCVAGAIPTIVLLVRRNEVAGLLLIVFGVLAFGSLIREAVRSNRVDRDRMFVAFILMFFSMLFWAFFEQAGSSVNNFTDRNIDRVFEGSTVAEAQVGSSLKFRVPLRTDDPDLGSLPLLSQEQLGYRCDDELFERVDRAMARQRAEKAQKGATAEEKEDESIVLTIAPGAGYEPGDPAGAAGTIDNDDKVLTMTHLRILRDEAARDGATAEDKVIAWTVRREHVGMGVGGAEIPASEFQAANPVFILLFGLVFTALWSFLSARGWEPTTPVKFALGILQLGLGFGSLWYGAQTADDRGIVLMHWLLLGYLLHTTGELCLSPVGLSMVTRLSPARIVSTVMGAWFLATAFSNYLAGIIATFTGVIAEAEGEQLVPPPHDTVNLYGNVFGHIAVTAVASALICFALSPLLNRWMHPEAAPDESGQPGKA